MHRSAGGWFCCPVPGVVSGLKIEVPGVVSGLRIEGAFLQPPGHIAVPHIFYFASIGVSKNGLGE